MKTDIASLIAVAATVAKHIESGKQALTLIREVVKKEHPGDLAAFDAQVASASSAWQGPADAGARENASVAKEE